VDIYIIAILISLIIGYFKTSERHIIAIGKKYRVENIDSIKTPESLDIKGLRHAHWYKSSGMQVNKFRSGNFCGIFQSAKSVQNYLTVTNGSWCHKL